MFGRSKNDSGPAAREDERRVPDFHGGPEAPAATLDPLAGEDGERERFAPRPNRPTQETRAPEVRAPEVRTSKVPPTATRSSGKPDEDKTLTVGKDISLHGEIADCAKVHVDGKVEATLSKCRALIITDSGYFGGTAEVDTADISGRFDGSLECTGRLIIREIRPRQRRSALRPDRDRVRRRNQWQGRDRRFGGVGCFGVERRYARVPGPAVRDRALTCAAAPAISP